MCKQHVGTYKNTNGTIIAKNGKTYNTHFPWKKAELSFIDRETRSMKSQSQS